MNSNIRKKILIILNNKFVQSIIYSRLLDNAGWFVLSFVKTEAGKIRNDESILDIGAGELRYKKYFNHCRYVSNDLCVGDKQWYFKDIDIKATAYNIPVKDNSFDYILSTQVLEHLEFPDKAFKECNRILKKGGKLLMTAPLGTGEHQIPHDYFRFTKYALKSLGRNNNFKLIYIKPQGGIFISLEYVLWQAINTLLPFKNNLIFSYFMYFAFMPFKLISGIMFCLLDCLDRDKVYTLNYSLIYKKI
jgi:SAM-dependent methyltransferase